MSRCSSPGQPEHIPNQKEKKQNPLILDTNRLGKAQPLCRHSEIRAAFVGEIIHCELFALLISCFPSVSRAHLSSHICGYQSGPTPHILPESPQIYSSAGVRRHHRAGEKPPDLNASEEPLRQPRAGWQGPVTPQGCSPGAMPEPPGATVCLRRFNSGKAKGAYAGGT